MTSKFFITTPIYYVNDLPHIGHTYTTIAADVLARFYRQRGRQVFFLTGTDEHGQKVAKSAKAAGLQPQEFTDKIAAEFKKTWQKLNISFDFFIRTTEPFHEEYVKGFLNKIWENGDIYPGQYEGLYCVGCEEYKSQDQLENGICLIHKTPCEKVKEKVYFFKLSKYQKELQKIILKNQLEIAPETRKNEVLSFIKKGLKDVAISRSKVEWGIKVPWDKKQTVYVWVDALLNYLSGDKNHFWPADLHLIGKDILRFHAVIWPALLLSVRLPLPQKIFVHGFFTISGKKMSKSLGNVIDPVKLAKTYAVDVIRYFILREFSFGEDGDFSQSRLKERYQNDLANDLGNLVQRTLSLIKKEKIKIKPGAAPSCAAADHYLEQIKFKEALDEIWKLIGQANREIDQKKPWVKGQKEKIKILTSLYRQIETIATALKPFLPETSKKIQNQLKTLKIKPIFPSTNL